jgi:hypothetical protein
MMVGRGSGNFLEGFAKWLNVAKSVSYCTEKSPSRIPAIPACAIAPGEGKSELCR